MNIVDHPHDPKCDRYMGVYVASDVNHYSRINLKDKENHYHWNSLTETIYVICEAHSSTCVLNINQIPIVFGLTQNLFSATIELMFVDTDMFLDHSDAAY